MYHVVDKVSARSCELFNGTVLELVKLIQASLAIFGMFELHAEERNGVLCDITCEGMRRWFNQIGEQYIRGQVVSIFTFKCPEIDKASLLIANREDCGSDFRCYPVQPYSEHPYQALRFRSGVLLLLICRHC